MDGTDPKEISYEKVYYHFVGKTQVEDILIADTLESKEWAFASMEIQVSHCGKFLLVYHGYQMIRYAKIPQTIDEFLTFQNLVLNMAYRFEVKFHFYVTIIKI